MAKVKLIRPLDGNAIGSTVEYPDEDAKRLAAGGVVEIVGYEKAAPASDNKNAPPVANKAAPAARHRKG